MARLARPIISTQWLTEQVDDSWTGVHLGRTEVPLDDAVTGSLDERRRVIDIFNHLEMVLPVGAFVLRCRMGFQTGEPETLDVIGRRLGVTRERIRQIEKQALEVAQEHAGLRDSKTAVVSRRGSRQTPHVAQIGRKPSGHPAASLPRRALDARSRLPALADEYRPRRFKA